MSRRLKIVLTFVGLFAVAIAVLIIFGNEGKNEAFQPQNEFKLDPWVTIKIGSLDLSINKAVLYLVLACGATIATLLWIANRMEQRPNRVQTAVELAYGLMKDNITGANMDRRMATRWFAFVGTLFLFIWFSNMIGYLPLPTNTEHKVSIIGIDFPAFALYAATANISVTLVLTLVVWFAYHTEGVRAKGPIGYLRSWVPEGVSGPAAIPIFAIEVISHFVRIISLSVRLFANLKRCRARQNSAGGLCGSGCMRASASTSARRSRTSSTTGRACCACSARAGASRRSTSSPPRCCARRARARR